MIEWIAVKDKLPEEGKYYWLKVEYWRYGRLHHEADIRGKVYIFSDMVMLDNDDESDEHYVNVTHYREID